MTMPRWSRLDRLEGLERTIASKALMLEQMHEHGLSMPELVLLISIDIECCLG